MQFVNEMLQITVLFSGEAALSRLTACVHVYVTVEYTVLCKDYCTVGLILYLLCLLLLVWLL